MRLNSAASAFVASLYCVNQRVPINRPRQEQQAGRYECVSVTGLRGCEPGACHVAGNLHPRVVVAVRQGFQVGYERVQLGTPGLQQGLAVEGRCVGLIGGRHSSQCIEHMFEMSTLPCMRLDKAPFAWGRADHMIAASRRHAARGSVVAWQVADRG
jgi:hypothetical protein